MAAAVAPLLNDQLVWCGMVWLLRNVQRAHETDPYLRDVPLHRPAAEAAERSRRQAAVAAAAARRPAAVRAAVLRSRLLAASGRLVRTGAVVLGPRVRARRALVQFDSDSWFERTRNDDGAEFSRSFRIIQL